MQKNGEKIGKNQSQIFYLAHPQWLKKWLPWKFINLFVTYVIVSSSILTCRNSNVYFGLYRQAQLKKSKQIFKIRHIQIDEIPRTIESRDEYTCHFNSNFFCYNTQKYFVILYNMGDICKNCKKKWKTIRNSFIQ